MRRNQFLKIIVRFVLTLTFFLLWALPVYSTELTQRDWMITLVDTVGWSYGLPDEPQDPDYINILTGNREFRFEAEEVYARDEDNVSIMSFQNYGNFGGIGWLHGAGEPTTVHLRFNLPIGGKYLLKAHLRLAGHRFSVNGANATVDAKTEFSLETVGSFQLQAGDQEVVVTLPPGGSIDYITLKAPKLVTITPDDGWQPDEVLTWKVIQTTMLQLLDLAVLFPSSPTPLVIEAEDLAQTELHSVGIQHLGRPSGDRWLRAGPYPAKVLFPVRLKESGFYDLTLRVMGDPIDVSVGDYRNISLAAKAYLDDYTFKSLFFFAGNSNITLLIPPGGGVDQLTLAGRQINTTLADTLLGLEHHENPTARDLDNLTTLLAAFGVKR